MEKDVWYGAGGCTRFYHIHHKPLHTAIGSSGCGACTAMHVDVEPLF